VYVNAHNHDFDAHAWLNELRPGVVKQIHIVGHGTRNGRLVDDHGASIQSDLLDLMAAAVSRHDVEAVIVERDMNIPGPPELLHELARVRRSIGGA
jgi:uncharacterized protein